MKDDPVIIVSDDGVSLEMEKYMSQDPMNHGVKANKILEINPNHPIFKVLQEEASNTETLKDYSEVLYDQALLIQGLPIEDPVTYSRKITDLLIKASK